MPVSSPSEAELTKLLENTFRHVNIALVNELAMFAHDLGIDVWEAIDAASTKPFGYMRFTPGPGRRRPLPADRPVLPVVAGARSPSAQPFRFVELANDVNDHMPDYVVRRADRRRSTERKLAVNGQRILLLGLAYKRNTGDARESPSTPIADQLVALGAEVLAADPHVDDRHLPTGVDPRRRHPRAGRRLHRRRAAGRPRRLRPRRHRRATPPTCSTPATASAAPPSSTCS